MGINYALHTVLTSAYSFIARVTNHMMAVMECNISFDVFQHVTCENSPLLRIYCNSMAD